MAGDLVLRCMEAVARAEEHGKLTANWESPYKVAAQVHPEIYCLKTVNGSFIPRAWHRSNLIKYYTLGHAFITSIGYVVLDYKK